MVTILEVVNLYAAYGSIEVLHGISLTILQGEIVTLIGANGAGKTTLLKAICGLLHLKKGKIIYSGKDISALKPHQVVTSGITMVPEGRKIFPLLTVKENLELGAYLCSKKNIREQLEFVYNLFPVLQERQKQLAGTLSGGEQQMLSIARALMAKPQILLLDEPSMGLAPILVERIFDTIKEINNFGKSILLVEQNVYQALKIAQRGYVMETGKIVLSGTAEELLINPQVKSSYLGG